MENMSLTVWLNNSITFFKQKILVELQKGPKFQFCLKDTLKFLTKMNGIGTAKNTGI